MISWCYPTPVLVIITKNMYTTITVHRDRDLIKGERERERRTHSKETEREGCVLCCVVFVC